MLARILLGTAACLILASPARAQSPLPPGQPVPLPQAVPEGFRPVPYGVDFEPTCTAVYLNETGGTGFFFPAGGGVEVADDLHTVLGGTEPLCAIDFGYYKPDAGTVDATITIYANNPADGAPGAVLAGPYVLGALPSGLQAFHVELPAGLIGPDVWLGIAFGDASTGLLLFGPPTLGSSHDRMRVTPPGADGNFAGSPRADFFLGAYASSTTPAVPASWGRLKSHYR